jgi:hypothetical protein
MKGPIVFGKRRQSTTEALRSFRSFNTKTTKQPEQTPVANDTPVTVNPKTDQAEAQKEQEEEEEDASLPGDMLRIQHQMHGGGWTPINARQEAPPETEDMGTSISTLLNRDVIQKIADLLKIKIPFKLAQDILKRHVETEKPTARIMQQAAKELMPVMDRETRTTVPPAYRHRLTQMLARTMLAYLAGKGTQLTGSGRRLRRKMDPDAYHPHAQAFVRGLMLAIKPALSLGATAMSLSPSIAGKLLAPAVQAAANTL